MGIRIEAYFKQGGDVSERALANIRALMPSTFPQGFEGYELHLLETSEQVKQFMLKMDSARLPFFLAIDTKTGALVGDLSGFTTLRDHLLWLKTLV